MIYKILDIFSRLFFALGDIFDEKMANFSTFLKFHPVVQRTLNFSTVLADFDRFFFI